MRSGVYRAPDGQALIDEARAEASRIITAAREAAEALAQAANENMTVRYLHEPSAGVANARNAAIAATTSRLIAFLDDDRMRAHGVDQAGGFAQTVFT